MRATLHWHTLDGTITPDNRDACAHSDQAHASLYLIADGSSSHPCSGELAKALLAKLTLDFSLLPATEQNPEQLAEAILQIIARSHQALSDTYPHAACSYLVLCLLADTAFSIHEGDCCLGVIEQSSKIEWLSSAHCAANWQGNLTHAEIAQSPARHRLTRCFSARRASNPEINHWPIGPNQHWLLATDGFWAGLSEQQQQTFLNKGSLPAPPTDDDISCLSIISNCVYPAAETKCRAG